MGDFFTSVLNGTFDFNKLVSFFGGLLDQAKANAGIMGIWDSVMGVIGGFLPIILIALGVVELLFGRKFLGLQKFIMSAALGYCIGVLAIAPIINGMFTLSEMICGAVVAVVAAVLCKQVYAIALFGGVGIFTYVICYAGGLIPVALPTVGNQVLSLAAAGVLIFLVLILRKNFERLGLALLGAYLITYSIIHNYFDFTALVAGHEVIVNVVVTCAIGLLGFAFQYKRRKRY